METPSPFLPGTKLQFAWDSTSLGWFKTCPRLYQYSMIEGWRRSIDESVHLRFGIEYHSALEDYDKHRADAPEATHDEALLHTVWKTLQRTWEPEIPPDEMGRGRPAGPWTPDHNYKNRETLIRSIIWYLDQFADDPAKTITLSNGKPAVELSFKMPTSIGIQGAYIPDAETAAAIRAEGREPNQGYMLCGHLDRVVDFGGLTYVADRKTTGQTLSPHYFDQFTPDNQMSLYTIAAKVIYKISVSGIIIDAAQIAVGFTRFERGLVYRTQAQDEEWLKDLEGWFRLAEKYAEADYWPMNDKSCFGCTFRKVCSKSPEVREVFLNSDFEKRPWNPLVAR